MTSENGWSLEMRRSPPVFHLRKLSCTRPSQGLRNSPHGSHEERGMTVTSANSRCAFFGRSPPLNVCTSRIISALFSKPASSSGRYTRWERRGLVAMKMWAPGTMTRKARRAKSEKKCRRLESSSAVKMVNRGSGLRTHPSKAGGILHTPPSLGATSVSRVWCIP